MAKKICTAFGNCQADALVRVLLDNAEFHSQYDYRVLPYVHELTPADVPAVLDVLHNADLLFYQHVFSAAAGPKLLIEQVMAALPDRAMRLSMPVLQFSGYTPHLLLYADATTLVGNEHDAAILYGFLQNLRVDEVLAVIEHPDFYESAFALEQANSALTALKKREHLLEPDIVASAFIHAHWRAHQLFDGTVHPRRPVLEHMATQVLTRLGCDPAAGNPMQTAQIYRLGVCTMPIYPSIIRGLGLGFTAESDLCVTSKGVLTLRQVVGELLAFYARHARSTLQALVEFQRPFVIERYNALLAQPTPTGLEPPAPRSASLPPPPTYLSVTPAAPTLPLRRVEHDLLVAALGNGSDFVTAAWQRWQASTDLDTLPGEQFLLLPKLYANLNQLNLAQTVDARIKGIFRRSWWRHQQVIKNTTALCSMLQAAGLPAFIAGDSALALSLYPGTGERPLEQSEILTLPAYVPAATELLMAAGWQPQTPNLVLRPALRRWIAQATYHQAAQPPLVLYWQLTPVPPNSQLAPRLLEIVVSHEGEEGRFNREALLVSASIQAAAGGRQRLLAAADAYMAVTAGQPINWDRAFEIAYILQAARPLAATLRTLASLFALPGEDMHLARLDRLAALELPLPRQDNAHRPGAPASWTRAGIHLHRWRRIARAQNIKPTAASLTDYLQAITGANRRRDLLPWLWRGLTRRLPRHASDAAPIA